MFYINSATGNKKMTITAKDLLLNTFDNDNEFYSFVMGGDVNENNPEHGVELKLETLISECDCIDTLKDIYRKYKGFDCFDMEDVLCELMGEDEFDDFDDETPMAWS